MSGGPDERPDLGPSRVARELSRYNVRVALAGGLGVLLFGPVAILVALSGLALAGISGDAAAIAIGAVLGLWVVASGAAWLLAGARGMAEMPDANRRQVIALVPVCALIGAFGLVSGLDWDSWYMLILGAVALLSAAILLGWVLIDVVHRARRESRR